MRDGVINYSAPLISSLAGLVLVPIMLSALGSETYGLWIAALAVAGLVGVVNLGLSWSVTRAVAMRPEALPPNERMRIVNSLATVYLVVGMAGALLIAVVGLGLSDRLHLTGHTVGIAPTVFALVAVAFIGDQIVAFASAVFVGLRRFDVLNAIAIVTSLGRLVGIVVLLAAGAGLVAIVAWQVVVSALTATVARLVLKKLAPEYRVRPARVPLALLRPHLGFGVTSVLATAASGLFFQTASLLIGLVRGSIALTAYTVGQKFPLAVSAMLWQVAVVAFPVAVRGTHAKDTTDLRRTLTVGTRWVVVLTIPICIELAILAPNLLHSWLGHVPGAAPGVLRITTAAVLVDALGFCAMVLLWGAGGERRILQILAVVVAVNIGSSLGLLYLLGLSGPALGFLLSMVVGSAALLYFAAGNCSIRPMSLLRQTLGGLALPTTLCAASTAALTFAIDPRGWFGVIGIAIVGASVYVLALAITGARPEERMFGRDVLRGLADVARWGVRRTAGALRSSTRS